MRFMVMVKATPETEKGALPDPQLLLEMGKFNEESQEGWRPARH